MRATQSTCCAPSSWNSSTATSVWLSGGSAPHDFPLYTFDFPAILSPNKAMVMELARCEYVVRRENVIAVGNSDTGKTHVALGLGWPPALAGCPWASPPPPPWSPS